VVEELKKRLAKMSSALISECDRHIESPPNLRRTVTPRTLATRSEISSRQTYLAWLSRSPRSSVQGNSPPDRDFFTNDRGQRERPRNVDRWFANSAALHSC